MDVINKIKEWWKKVLDKFKGGSDTMSLSQMTEIDRNVANHFMERR
tara:strand:- start:625 stop:762 length:138 start_codon:yes stop_codon:yes gene_type:complete